MYIYIYIYVYTYTSAYASKPNLAGRADDQGPVSLRLVPSPGGQGDRAQAPNQELGPGRSGDLASWDVELSNIGKTAMSILSRDPSLSRKPSEPQGKQLVVEKNDD